MGVPGFFLWFLKKYKTKNFIIKDKIKCDSLLIDTNCLLHPQCFKILAENSKTKDYKKLENKMIEGCINYLDYIINYASPSKEIYIAIDGVAPAAKIKQQRQRRFKSVNDKQLFDNIKKKYNKEITTYWNNSAITPGTNFMKKLTESIIKFCENKKNIKIYFSTANTPSEGEHKLLQHIKKSNNNYNYVIYGLDADLIFLALACKKNNIHLLREETEIKKTDKSNKLNFISIDVLKDCIIEEINDILMDEFIDRNLDKERVIQDFIFICYFLGNDFLPHIPSIDIKCHNKKCVNGLDILLQGYANTYDNIEDYLIDIKDDNINYNLIFLQMFLEYLTQFEEEFFFNLYKTKKYYKKCSKEDPYDEEMYKIDNLQFKIEDDIELGKDNLDDYKFRYYKKYYFSEINQTEQVKFACYKYFEGLFWVANYYFKECKSWDWYYPYDHAPFISDLNDNLKRFNLDNITFNLGRPLKPVEQLLCVLPSKSKFLIPNNLQWLMTSDNSPLIHLYPIKYDIDLLYKTKYWQGIPILPDLEIDLVKKVVEKYYKNNNFNSNILIYN